MIRAPIAQINLSALRHNYRELKLRAGNSQLMAVIKANAYGHGLLEVANALNEAEAFALSCYQEAVALRAAGINNRLVMLEGFHSEQELLECEDAEIEWVIHHPWQVELLCSPRLQNRVSIWIKIDTGMGRLGIRQKDFAAILATVQGHSEKIELRGFITHLANADLPADPRTAQQLQLFETLVKEHSGLRSVANSAALCAWPDTHKDWVRPGIMLYGVSPFADRCGKEEGLRPVMTLKSRLISIKNLNQGDAVSYGGTWVCPESMPVGVVAIGYGDGYPRHAVSSTPVLIRGVRVPIVGRVTMDMVCVDLRLLPDAAIGDEVILWGEDLPIEEIAKMSGTIAYELLCQLTSRVKYQVEYGKE